MTLRLLILAGVLWPCLGCLAQEQAPLPKALADAHRLRLGICDAPLPAPLALDASVTVVPTPQQPYGWRGDGTGHFPAARPPLHWSVSKNLNIRWRRPLSAAGGATPLVLGGLVIVRADYDQLIALDADSGAERWRWGQAAEPPGWSAKHGGHDDRLTDTFATPACDGQLIYVKRVDGAVAALDLQGQLVWTRPAPATGDRSAPPAAGQASPLLVAGRLIVGAWSHDRGQLSALDPADGALLWTTRVGGSNHGMGCSPVAMRLDARDLIITPCGHAVDAATGAILAAELGPASFGSSPVVAGDRVYFQDVYSFKGNRSGKTGIRGVRLSTDSQGGLVSERILDLPCHHPGNPSPLVVGELLYAIRSMELSSRSKDCDQIALIDLAHAAFLPGTEPVFAIAIDRWQFPSPCLAGERIVVPFTDGTVVVLEPGPGRRVLARNDLGPDVRMHASPWFAGKRIYFRTRAEAICVEEQ